MASPSAVARVFAIPELLEEIILQVMRIPKYPKPRYADPLLEHFRHQYITDPFPLKRVSRDFNRAIVGSSKIQCGLFTLRFPEHVPEVMASLHRIWWIGIASGLISSINTICNVVYIHALSYAFKRVNSITLDRNASWRRITCLQKGTESVVVRLHGTGTCCVVSDTRFKKLHIDEHYTLGESYEEMVAVHHGY
ncbi:hypothetical protein AC579_3145 [Pseudocercospora musae]|uniref:Uncharacterized protein n=1 Tax=Pseudocercospora musae TaxID=113226 RepID=A0A139H5W1_9PEZI|nr:hypothetical protein AC579_3145 [Pseudocercospora musae]